MLQDVDEMVDETGIPRIVGCSTFIERFPSQHHTLDSVPLFFGAQVTAHPTIHLHSDVVIKRTWPTTDWGVQISVFWEKLILTLKIMHFAVDFDLLFKRNLSRVEELLRNIDVVRGVWIVHRQAHEPRNGVLQRKREHGGSGAHAASLTEKHKAAERQALPEILVQDEQHIEILCHIVEAVTLFVRGANTTLSSISSSSSPSGVGLYTFL